MDQKISVGGINYFYHGAEIPEWAWPTQEQIRKDLEDALSYLREHGWCKGSMSDDSGSVCAIGALHYHIAHQAPSVDWNLDPTLVARYFSARAHLDLKTRVISGKILEKTEQYNDLYATERGDVETLYEKAIADL